MHNEYDEKKSYTLKTLKIYKISKDAKKLFMFIPLN